MRSGKPGKISLNRNSYLNQDLKDGRKRAIYLGKSVLKKEEQVQSPAVEAGVLGGQEGTARPTQALAATEGALQTLGERSAPGRLKEQERDWPT